MNEIWTELRRRNIFRVAAAYVVLGWMILQVTGLVVPGFDMPDWTFPFVSFVLIIGFPLVLIFAWAFELTPDGLKRTGEVNPEHSVALHTGRKLDFLIIGVLSLALLLLVIDRLFLPPAVETISPPGTAAASIAVLPFVNMSSDPEQAYFSDGMSEEILNVLSQIPGLHVTSRSSAFQFRGDDIHIPTVAGQLGVANILEGSVRKSGTRIKITAQLIEASTDGHLWSQTYERELVDIFTIQEEISRSIVDALYVHLGLEAPSLPEVREIDPEAYRLYLLGRHNFEQRTKETLYKAIDLFDQAIAIDPDYARAFSGKADAYMLLDGYDSDFSRSESMTLAEPLIERALALDPDLADAHVSKGLLLQGKQQIEASLQSFDRAIELNPNLSRAWHWRGFAVRYTGDRRESFENSQRAHALDPLSPTILKNLIWSRVLFGQFSEAEELLKRLRAIAPDDDNVSLVMSWLQGLQGNWSGQYTHASAAFEEDPDYANSDALASSQVLLRAFDPAKTEMTSDIEILYNSNVDPEMAWRDYQALTPEMKDSRILTDVVALTGVRLGRHKEAIELLESLPGFTGSFPGPIFASFFPWGISAPVLALARRQAGDEAGARRVIAEIEAYVRAAKDQGVTLTLSFLEAEVHALKGEDDEVIAALRQAHTDGYLRWFDLDYPFFDAIRDREDFQAIVRSVDAKVNEERAKLGWEPVE